MGGVGWTRGLGVHGPPLPSRIEGSILDGVDGRFWVKDFEYAASFLAEGGGVIKSHRFRVNKDMRHVKERSDKLYRNPYN